ncbi:MarR family transcriptional regulator [Nocardia sp. NRRL WC-3656]|uniref:MarR family transcriptional regulator n=1 Tax=Nocardia sp. NRRL WC-3656 TaxID=1463824 RepID=UPI00068A96F0|nr:MarR family transcriptional regulator [Nocardia sp. NRRL WC-3656]
MITDPDRAAARTHRQRTNILKATLRELNTQMALLNRHFGRKVDLKDSDWTCLDLLNGQGPMSPTELSRRAGIHPSTLTRIIDRLERGGWVIRERSLNVTDRRAVTIRASRARNQELYKTFDGMSKRMDDLCQRYTEDELEFITVFIRSIANAGLVSVEELVIEC